MNRKQISSKINASIWSLLAEFNEQFMVGLAAGVMALSVILYKNFGLGFSLTASGQMHLISLDVIFLLIPIAYALLKYEQNNGKRVLASLCFSVFVFSIHDVAWLIETHFVPPVFAFQIAELDLTQYVYHYSKNAMNIIISLVGIGHYLHINKKFIGLFGIQVLFHLVNIIYKIDGYILNPYLLIIMYLCDTIPYLFLIHGKRGTVIWN